jgi:hypothetical protein
MPKAFPVGLGLALAMSALPVSAQAQGVNPEDEPIPDQPVPVAPPAPPAPAPVTPPPAPSAPTAPATPAPATGDTITVPRAVWEQLLKDVEDLKKARATQEAAPPPPAPTPAPAESTPTSSAPGSRNYLLLPDISFVSSATALGSTDKRDPDRNNLDVEGEIGIQGYAYPNVKYDAFIVGNPGENEAFNVEEGYLTFLGAAKGLNINVGRKFAAFGRTGELHPHSWLYSRQFIARQSLVAPENLVGNGIQFNYLLPTPSSFFARASFGVFGNGEENDARVNTFNPADPFEGGFPTRPGAGLTRFYNGRLWLGKSLAEDTELELGLSAARGRSAVTNIVDDGTGSPTDVNVAGRVDLSGADISLRKFLPGGKRLLLRSELFRYNPKDLPTVKSSGYYALANYRFNKFNDVGLLWEKTDYPTAPGDSEKALSLIYTRQFSERYYMRFTGTNGSRPGDSGYNELRIQLVAGLGPHTHELE